MSQYKIATIVGSLRAESLNQKMADALVQFAPAHFSFTNVSIADLPSYNQDDDGHQAEVVLALKAAIKSAHGVLFVTPEYNRSIPGVLKNAIDHASRPYGQSAWAGKPAGVMGVSIGAPGASMGQQHLRNVLAYLDMPTLNQPEMYIQANDGLFDDTGNIGPDSEAFVQAWMDRFVAWVEKHS